jgi:hypothetical protein
MPADKDPIRSTHDTLALIADKLAMDRKPGDDFATTDPPFPPVPADLESTQPAQREQSVAMSAAKAEAEKPAVNETPAATAQTVDERASFSEKPSSADGRVSALQQSVPQPVPVPVVPRAVAVPRQPVRDALVTNLPIAIAVLARLFALYHGYDFHESLKISQQSIDAMQRNVARGDFSRACRDIIETYYEVKQKVSILMPAADRSNVVGASRVTEANRLEAQIAIAKFGGLGTYLANFQDAAARARYTELTRTLTGIMEAARTTQLPEIDKLFLPADRQFGQMNEDCARLSRTMRM